MNPLFDGLFNGHCSINSLIDENVFLRQLCNDQTNLIEMLKLQISELHGKCQTQDRLYNQQKKDRYRISRLLASAQREIVHLKRMQGNDCRRRIKHRNDSNEHSLNPPPYRESMRLRHKSRANCRYNNDLDDSSSICEKPTYRRFESLDTNISKMEKLKKFQTFANDDLNYLNQINQSDQYMDLNTIRQLFELHQGKLHQQIDEELSNVSNFKHKTLQQRNSFQECIEFTKSLLDPTNIDKSEVDCPSSNNETQEVGDYQQKLNCVEDASQKMSTEADIILFDETSDISNNEDCSGDIEAVRPIDLAMETLTLNLCLTNSESTNVREIKLSKNHDRFYGIFFESSLSSGVVVRQVVPNSEAARAGVQAWDRLLEICGINMRKAHHCFADKILRDCEEDMIVLKLVSTETQWHNQAVLSSDSSLSLVTTDSATDCLSGCKLVKKQSTLMRRKAFKKKYKAHKYFERKNDERTMLYQACHLTVSIPRRINVKQSLEKLRLLGGNAVGIFVHSTVDELLSKFLQTGDQLLEYNNIDLTKVTAEDAAIELAKPTRGSVLVALYNVDAYNQIHQKSIGDSFYIRTEFNRSSVNKSLEFKKGDILHIDNTLYNGKPGFWRACKVDKYGEKTECGVIPSKYNADCELLRQVHSSEQDKLKRFRFLRIFFRRSRKKCSKLKEKTKVLASFSYTYFENQVDEPEEPTGSSISVRSYQLVNMLPQVKPRPLIIFGPFSNILAQKLETIFPEVFRQCLPQTQSTVDISALESKHQYLYCIHKDSAYECVLYSTLSDVITQNLHPVVPVVVNTVADFHTNNIFPVVAELKFRSARHLKDTVNKWNIANIRVATKTARAMYNHMLKLESEFQSIIDITVTGNNLMFMCTQIKERLKEEQHKVIWCDVVK